MTITEERQQEVSAQVATTSRSSAAMSLTYSDFLYTRNDYDLYDDDLREERRSLPSDFRPIQETKVPLLQNADDVNQDFILIAEFSELEGPIPLCTIPGDAPDKTDIKLNDFVVHLMSTDYQVNNVGQFKICQDTQVMRKNVFPDAHVFMQYFTLYDIKARGFVRPFCFGYVSKDHIKLDKHISFLISEFSKVTAVLKHCNRDWFSKELTRYLEKLQKAKEGFINEHSGNATVEGDERKDNQSDEFADSETITLAQIAHQYSEIHNILTTVQNFESSNQYPGKDSIQDVSIFFERNPECSLANFLERIHILPNRKNSSLPNCFESITSDESLINVPLVHPLRAKGECLRPFTVLGQLGSVHLVGKLMQIYNCCKMDIIFAELTETTIAFRQHFDHLRLSKVRDASTSKGSSGGNSPGRSSSGISSSINFDNSANSGNNSNSAPDVSYCEEADEETLSRIRACSDSITPFELLQDNNGTNPAPLWVNLKKKELLQILERVHISSPIIPDNKSGSYHTVSEEESDSNIHSQTEAECESSSVLNSTVDTVPDMFTEAAEQVDDKQSRKVTRMSSFSSEEDISMSLNKSSYQYGSSEEVILKEPWWIHASRKLVPGVPGYGLGNFFRRYNEVAHHVLFSILLGRPIIICGEEKLSRKIGRIITALIPLIPGGPNSSNNKSWKLLRWHRGILVQAHIEAYRLVGLCIPEKLEVHDLIPPRLVTFVTILSIEQRSILGGPAYSGNFLQGFEKKVQKHFHNSDVSLLSYIGGIYAEIEAKTYMYKSLVDSYKGKKGNSTLPTLCKELCVKASDVEIIKYLASLISDPSDCVNVL